MPRGYVRPLYVLPFDHRASFEAKMFGWKTPLSGSQVAQIADAKRLIFEGFQAAVRMGVDKDKAGILVDEQFGAAILRDAAAAGYATAISVEKSGQDEFDFEYGLDFARHIGAFKPKFAKVLVRYNPEGDERQNQRQGARLKRLSDHLIHIGQTQLMFELLVPPTEKQLLKLDGDRAAYDRELRPRLMVQAIQELHQAGVEPDVWKIEGLDKRRDCVSLVAAAQAEGRTNVGCIVLGRGEDDQKVVEWLTVAAGVSGFIGFAVGRTVFWDPLVAWRTQTVTRHAAAEEIARRYHEFVSIFEAARHKSTEGA
jgi:myo-inositol catabolism protein IolC